MGKTVNVRKKDDTKRAFSYLIKFFVPNVRYEPRVTDTATLINVRFSGTWNENSQGIDCNLHAAL